MHLSKKFLIYLLYAAVLIPGFSSIAMADITSNLLYWWKFDEGSGSTVADSTGNGNTGNLTNSPTWSTGNLNGGITLDGNNQEMTTTNDAAAYQNNFTMACWFKTTHLAGKKIIGFEAPQTGTGRWAYDRGISLGWDGKVYFAVYPNPIVSVGSTATYNDGSWHHAAATYDGVNMELFMDGASVGTNTGNAIDIGGGYYLRVGGYGGDGFPNTWNGYFPGEVDDCRLYNRVLTSGDISELYAWRPPSATAIHSIGNATLGSYSLQ